MWLKHPKTLSTTNQQKPKYQSRNYPSKVLTQLMNSDSEDDYLQQVHDIKHMQKNIICIKQSPPLLINPKQSIKENLQHHANQLKKQIKYQCYKLYDGKLLQVPSSHQFNSLNLQQTSIIKENTESQQLQKLTQQFLQQQKLLMNRINQLQEKNRALQHELAATNEKLQTKQQNSPNQIQPSIKRIKQYEQKQKQNPKKQQNIKKQLRQNRQNQYIKYLSKNNKQNILQPNSSQSIIQNLYKQIKLYLIKRIEQFKNNLSQHKMNQFVQDIIEQFMTQLININSITVSRVVFKNKKNSSTHLKKIAPQNDISLLSKSCLFKQNFHPQFSQNPTKTPPKLLKKPPDQKQKPSQLKQLQKSLTKLRQMQKQYANKRHSYYNKDSLQPLDRSSILVFDMSRSKSRRKKIFQ